MLSITYELKAFTSVIDHVQRTFLVPKASSKVIVDCDGPEELSLPVPPGDQQTVPGTQAQVRSQEQRSIILTDEL